MNTNKDTYTKTNRNNQRANNAHKGEKKDKHNIEQNGNKKIMNN